MHPAATPLPLLNNARRRRLATASQGLRAAVALLALGAYALQYGLLLDVAQGLEVTAEQADANDWRVRLISWVQLPVALLALGTLVLWAYRAYQNVHRLPDATPRFGADAAAWGWFVPVVNLWIPYRVLADLGYYLGGFSRPDAQSVSSRWDVLLIGWWMAHVAVALFGRFTLSNLLGAAPASVTELLGQTRLLMGSQVVTCLSALLTLAVLRTLGPHEQQPVRPATAPANEHATPAAL